MQPSLAQIPFLADAAPEAIAAANAAAEWFSLPGGWQLFDAGEDAQHIYFLVSGSLAAFSPASSANPRRLLGYIRPGEPVGEMALIAGEPHSGSVWAVRDCELVRLSRGNFEKLLAQHPSLMTNLARVMLTRARQKSRRSPRTAPKVYALIATSPTIDLKLRAEALREALTKLGRRTAVVGESFPGADMANVALDTLERDHDVVLLISPVADTPWFKACLRQADRVWVLARSDARPSIPLLPDDPSPARQFKLVDVVLLHHGADRRAARAEEWREAADAARLLHWRALADEDCQRLARLIAGQAIAVVLSGGGARAYAHIGVIRALREAKVPIDQVGGTSMGAIVAGCVAMGWDDDEIEMRIRKAFVESNPLGDYVLPVVALSRGKRVEDRLAEHFGETMIEDLRTPFFCMSTNLASATAKLHRAGRLRDALRATISLPGILPPVVDADFGVLVDGAVLNNFPVDVMRAMHRGPIVGVDVAKRGAINPADFIDPPNFFGWVATRGLQAAPPIASLLMRAATMTVDPWQGRERTDLLVAPDMPDVDLRDWKKFDEAVSSGYQAAVSALKRQPMIGRGPLAEEDDIEMSSIAGLFDAPRARA
jgi:NTE family protein